MWCAFKDYMYDRKYYWAEDFDEDYDSDDSDDEN